MAESVWAITELRRTGAGNLQENPEGARFVWDGSGHTLPRAGVEMPVQVNTVRTVYPGTNRPVEQVISTERPPINIEGEWNDKFNFPGFAADQERAMAALAGRGSLVRMDFEQFSITGIITLFTPRLHHRTHIEWSLTFSVHYRDSPEALARAGQVLPATARPLREAATTTEATVDELEGVHLDARSLSLSGGQYMTTTTVVDGSRTVQDAINERAALGLTDNSQAELRSQRERYATLQGSGTVAAGRLEAARSGDSTSFDSVSQRLGFALWSRGVRSTGRGLIVQAARGLGDIDLVLVAQTKALIRPAADSSVYRVAAKFADAPEGWRGIALANNLSELFFDGVKELAVPVDRTI